MFLKSAVFCVFGCLIYNTVLVKTEIVCADGTVKLCPPHWVCCEDACCSPGYINNTLKEDEYSLNFRWSYFILAVLVGIFLSCVYCLCLMRTEDELFLWSCECCIPQRSSDRDSAGSVYPPPRYSRCSSFHQAPPPYSEVQSKPDLYPLVITCAERDGKATGSYLMVQYFRNCSVIRTTGTLSATSTAESLSSSFICNATNEANSIIPPPYSCASNYEEYRGCGGSLLRSLSSLTEPRAPPPPRSHTSPHPAPHAAPPRFRENTATYRENVLESPIQPSNSSYDLEYFHCAGRKPELGESPTKDYQQYTCSNSDETIYQPRPIQLRHIFKSPSPPPSPPQPTSPTETPSEYMLRRQGEDRRYRRLDSVLKTHKARKSSLYMPLTVAYPVATARVSPSTRSSSRSAPATPCGALVPNLVTFTQRVSASRHSSRSNRFEEESNPLLAENEHSSTSHKF